VKGFEVLSLSLAGSTRPTVLSSGECDIVGRWLKLDKKIIADDNCHRIDYLVSHLLIRLTSDPGGWLTLFQDPTDERYCELSYPESSDYGGGPPRLRTLTHQEARSKFFIK
jgi:hypothetical protein